MPIMLASTKLLAKRPVNPLLGLTPLLLFQMGPSLRTLVSIAMKKKRSRQLTGRLHAARREAAGETVQRRNFLVSIGKYVTREEIFSTSSQGNWSMRMLFWCSKICKWTI